MATTGVWIVGASGSVATTAMAGAVALAEGKAEPTGLVTALPQFGHVPFCAFDELVFGGHEVREPDLVGELESLHRASGLLSPELIELARGPLTGVAGRVRPGTAVGCGKPVETMATLPLIDEKRPADIVRRIREDLDQFAEQAGADRLVVVNLQSTEPPFPEHPCHQSLDALREALGHAGGTPLPASSLYCMAALEAGAAFINFTPSRGPDVPALLELAEETGGLVTGSDGKTGETLCKSVLAPLFAMRNLKILSWVGHNIFGNRDALVLDDPENKASKVKSKDHLIRQIVGYSPDTLVTIENIPSLGDWKTAWDHIHFEGFLGTKMTMQFTWQGCDSLLAAPLVLDLVRLAVLAIERGDRGVMTQTACFFKSPLGVDEQDMFKQFAMLSDYLSA
ncbi:MAG: inositol-3-phosphate synthase [Planctomycetota bacterium]